ncbi:MAG: FlgD immunoglobulin-like domain containing protein [Candidatus Eisenbacteria bacterium]
MVMRPIAIRSLALVLTGAVLSAGADLARAQFGLNRFTVDGGGSTRSIGGSMTLGGTIGQPDVGLAIGSSFALRGGFWFGGGGVTAVDLDPLVDGITPAGTTPPAFRLHDARPNPVTEQTRVVFELPQPSLVRANIYDPSGRLVRVLVDQALPAGTHKRMWDRRDQSGRRVPSGLCFLRFDAGPHHGHRRIVAIP